MVVMRAVSFANGDACNVGGLYFRSPPGPGRTESQWTKAKDQALHFANPAVALDYWRNTPLKALTIEIVNATTATVH